MIQANELRIGNWVNDVGSMPFKVDAVDIVTLSQCEVAGKVHLGYNPIPLSPDVLKACGFEKKRSDTMITWVNGDVKLMKSVDHDKAYFLCGLVRESKTVLLVYSLHQLQNLFHSLTGTELNYKP